MSNDLRQRPRCIPAIMFRCQRRVEFTDSSRIARSVGGIARAAGDQRFFRLRQIRRRQQINPQHDVGIGTDQGYQIHQIVHVAQVRFPRLIGGNRNDRGIQADARLIKIAQQSGG